VCRRVCPAPGPRRRPRGTAAAAAPGCAAAAAAARRPPATAPRPGTAAPALARRPWCGRTPCHCAAARAAPGTCSAARVTLQRRRRARRTAALRCLTRPGRLQRRTRVERGAAGEDGRRTANWMCTQLTLSSRPLPKARISPQRANSRITAAACSGRKPNTVTKHSSCGAARALTPCSGPTPWLSGPPTARSSAGGTPAPLARAAQQARRAQRRAPRLHFPDPGPGRSARRTSASAPSACPDGCSAAARSVTAPASCSSRLCCGGGGTGASLPLPVGVRLRRRGVAPSR